MLKTRKIPRTISALLLVELSIQEFLFDICHFPGVRGLTLASEYKRTLLGQEIVEIGAPQTKSAPESRLSYPIDPSTNMYVVGLGLRIPSPTPIFTRRNC